MQLGDSWFVEMSPASCTKVPGPIFCSPATMTRSTRVLSPQGFEQIPLQRFLVVPVFMTALSFFYNVEKMFFTFGYPCLKGHRQGIFNFLNDYGHGTKHTWFERIFGIWYLCLNQYTSGISIKLRINEIHGAFIKLRKWVNGNPGPPWPRCRAG